MTNLDAHVDLVNGEFSSLIAFERCITTVTFNTNGVDISSEIVSTEVKLSAGRQNLKIADLDWPTILVGYDTQSANQLLPRPSLSANTRLSTSNIRLPLHFQEPTRPSRLYLELLVV